jgi:hypothetical protein
MSIFLAFFIGSILGTVSAEWPRNGQSWFQEIGSCFCVACAWTFFWYFILPCAA